VAIKAMAAKLACLVNRMLRWDMPYVDRGAELYEEQHRQLMSSAKDLPGVLHEARARYAANSAEMPALIAQARAEVLAREL
jgi:hypothetical protein